MPPHCDSMDGPVVVAAQKALEQNDINLILPYVPKEGEEEVIQTFNKVLPLHKKPNGAREIADLYFYETVVRVHRAGEGAPFTGLKPAGLDVGPVIPIAEKAIETSSPDELITILTGMLKEESEKRFHHMLHLRHHEGESVEHAREYVEAMLGLQVWSHKVYTTLKSQPHEGHHEHG
jgi:hypothetical protein